jgi:hypothetical protein
LTENRLWNYLLAKLYSWLEYQRWSPFVGNMNGK